MSKTLLNPREAAAIIGVTRPGFVKMCVRGEVRPDLQIGNMTFFSPQTINHLKKKRANGKPRSGQKGKRK